MKALIAILFSLAIAGADAQAPASETPPDQKAYQDAVKVVDPAAKIAALEKFKRDFPNSASVSSATMSIFSTTALKMPDRQERIRDLARGIYAAEKDKKKRGPVANDLALNLLNANVLPKEAEKYAAIALKRMNQADYLKEQHAAFEKRKAANPAAKPSSDEELVKSFNQSRAVRVGTLGRAEYKLGKDAVARKMMEESYSVFPTKPVAIALGELTAKSGDDAKALDYLIAAKLYGNAPASVSDALSLVYSRLHHGSTQGLADVLDAEYSKRHPVTLHPDAYKPAATRSSRLVLAEVFTGSGCPPCVGASLAFDATLKRYTRQDLMVVMYHLHVPQPDPMTNPDTVARAKYYGVTGAPTYAVDGEIVQFHGAVSDAAQSVYDHIRPPIETDLEAPAEAGVTIQATLDGNAVKVTASVDPMKNDSPGLKVHVLLLEKRVVYSGENTIRFHPMVVRAMGGKDDDGFALIPGMAATFQQTFDLDKISAGLKAYLDDYEAKGHKGNTFRFSEKKDRIDRANLAVVVFVQDAKTKHILQSAYVDLNPQAGPLTENPAGSR